MAPIHSVHTLGSSRLENFPLHFDSRISPINVTIYNDHASAEEIQNAPVLDYVFAAQTVSADRRQEDRTCSVKEWKWYYRISVIGANHIRAP